MEMRSDYALYTVAIIFFILTGIAAAIDLSYPEKQLSMVATVTLGLLFAGLGYTQRPKPKAITVETPPHAPQVSTLTQHVETAKEEKVEPIVETISSIAELTQVKGIGEKRANQLKALGINNIEDLAKASAEDLAGKLKISPKITGKWIKNAEQLLKKA